MDYLNNLNEEQLLAVKTTEGYVRVIAGAGSGKTRALTSRYAYIVNNLGVSTSDVLCVTFTNKAANEMKKRVRGMIGDRDTSFICTFHGYCLRMLKEDIHVLNYPREFMVIDDEDAESILKNVYERLKISSSYKSFAEAKKAISFYKKNSYATYIKMLVDGMAILENYDNEELPLDKRIIFGYLYEQRKVFGLDFDDLILFAFYIFELREDILFKWQKRFVYVMVDEFQDVSDRQYALCDMLSGYHKNLFIVGDPDQTIYSWRGADVNLILNFDRFHPNCTDIVLNKNYRSTSNILLASNSLISKNKKRIPKDLVAVKSTRIPVIYNHTKTIQEEAEFISNKIKELMQDGYKFDDFAVLYRAHYVSRAIEQSFIQNDIKYVIYNGIEFFKRREIKDAISYLRMIVYSDDLSFQRVINVPKRNFGKKRMDIIRNYASINNISLYESLKKNLDNDLIKNTKAPLFVQMIEKYKSCYKDMKVSDVFSGILSESGYEEMLQTLADDDRIDNISELKNTIVEYENNNQEDMSLDEYLTSISLYTDAETKDSTSKVKMMTIHSAKGLEFPIVFVCSLNEGIFPSSKSVTMDQMEEERRLAYVAFTRAEDALFISDAEGYNYDRSFRYPSRFIFNIDRDKIDYVKELDSELVEESLSYVDMMDDNLFDQEALFSVHDRVVHDLLGEGEIISIDNDTCSYEIKFDKIDTTRNIRFSGPITKINSEINDIKDKNRKGFIGKLFGRK